MSSSVFLILLGLAAIARSQDVTAIWKQPQDNTCASWGDPHIWTWDGHLFSTQGSGYYHLLVSPRINIQAKFDHGCGGGDVTCVYGFRVFAYNDDDELHSFELKADFLADNNSPTSFRRPFNNYGFAYMTYIDGNDAHMVPAVNGGDPELVKAGVNQLVGANGGAKVAYYVDNQIYSVNLRYKDIVIQFLPWTISITSLNGNTNQIWDDSCGLCGSFDGKKWNDYQGRARKFTLDDDVDTYVATWKVTANDAKKGYFSCDNGPEPTVKPTPGPTAPPPTPTTIPSRAPTPVPTPTDTPTGSPTPASTPSPTPEPTNPATNPPTSRPTNPPTDTPTGTPTEEPTPSPTVPSTTGSVTTGGSTTGGNQTTNITVIVNDYNGTQAYTDANATCCESAHICPGDPLYQSCMMDVLKTNQTTLAVSATGAIVLAGCAKTNITDSSCTQGSLFACPGACAGAGNCVQGKCVCRKGFENDKDSGSCIRSGLTQAQLIAVGVSAGVVAAIVIGAVVFLALAGFGAKKGYDYYHMKDNKMANVNSNPLYNEKKTGGVSPLYAEKA